MSRVNALRNITIFVVLLLPQMVHADADHLVPISAYDSDGYSQAVFDSLIGESMPKLWMVVRPSFRPEYAIILYEYKGKWTLEKVEANEKIWKFKKTDDNHLMLDIKSTTNVTKNTIVFEDSDFFELANTWKAVLKDTRYPKAIERGLDGTRYQFYAHNDLFGEVWSPTSRRPFIMVLLGETLGEIVEAKEGERQSLVAKAKAIASELSDLTRELAIRDRD